MFLGAIDVQPICVTVVAYVERVAEIGVDHQIGRTADLMIDAEKSRLFCRWTLLDHGKFGQPGMNSQRNE